MQARPGERTGNILLGVRCDVVVVVVGLARLASIVSRRRERNEVYDYPYSTLGHKLLATLYDLPCSLTHTMP